MDGKTARGASSPAKPALHIPDPLSITNAAISSSISRVFFICSSVYSVKNNNLVIRVVSGHTAFKVLEKRIHFPASGTTLAGMMTF